MDESVDNRITKKLKTLNFDITCVHEYSKGITDIWVLKLARKFGSILITEDRDFGEWVFAHKEKNVSIIYLRYKLPDLGNIIDTLIKVLSERNQNLYGKFVVVTVNKIRIREIF